MKLRTAKKVRRKDCIMYYRDSTFYKANNKLDKQRVRWERVRESLYEQGFLSEEDFVWHRYGHWDPSYRGL